MTKEHIIKTYISKNPQDMFDIVNHYCIERCGKSINIGRGIQIFLLVEAFNGIAENHYFKQMNVCILKDKAGKILKIY